MSNTSKLNVGGSGEGFGITRLGGHQHGSNSLGVWLSGAIRLGLSDTVSFENYHGVGVVDAKLSRDELIDAKEIHRQLCAASINGPVHEVPVKRR
ncbi:hypothetical protein AWB74_06870 [Caballeronia arvi]|uniref:Uncharacterized protein n=2 Tax=Caballeronia arvi TaxID=1777135 RepID=A0A158KSX6_9BURK|nr:hypothetical protein AWB74_06870 [Caballeronia arvi]